VARKKKPSIVETIGEAFAEAVESALPEQKSKRYPGYKIYGGKAPVSSAADALGYRQLTRDELTRLGLSPTSRAYTTQRAGVKGLKKEKVVSRYSVLKQIRGVTPERYSQINRAKNANYPSPTGRSTNLAKRWRDENAPGSSIREVQRSPQYQAAKRALRTKSKRSAPRRIQALYDFGYIDHETYSEWMSMYEED
jgi:hypothetical protein